MTFGAKMKKNGNEVKQVILHCGHGVLASANRFQQGVHRCHNWRTLVAGAHLGDVVLGPGQRRAQLLPRHGAGGQLG